MIVLFIFLVAVAKLQKLLPAWPWVQNVTKQKGKIREREDLGVGEGKKKNKGKRKMEGDRGEGRFVNLCFDVRIMVNVVGAVLNARGH